MNDFPRSLKILTVWLVLLTAGVLGFSAWERQRTQPSVRVLGDGAEVLLKRGIDGHFHWPGMVAGRPVRFLIDTGATTLALPEALAAGLPRGETVRSQTANGITEGWTTRVTVELEGGIVLRELRAVVLPDLHVPLLGMNALRHLHIVQTRDMLRITVPQTR